MLKENRAFPRSTNNVQRQLRHFPPTQIVFFSTRHRYRRKRTRRCRIKRKLLSTITCYNKGQGWWDNECPFLIATQEIMQQSLRPSGCVQKRPFSCLHKRVYHTLFASIASKMGFATLLSWLRRARAISSGFSTPASAIDDATLRAMRSSTGSSRRPLKVSVEKQAPPPSATSRLTVSCRAHAGGKENRHGVGRKRR